MLPGTCRGAQPEAFDGPAHGIIVEKRFEQFRNEIEALDQQQRFAEVLERGNIDIGRRQQSGRDKSDIGHIRQILTPPGPGQKTCEVAGMLQALSRGGSMLHCLPYRGLRGVDLIVNRKSKALQSEQVGVIGTGSKAAVDLRHGHVNVAITQVVGNLGVFLHHGFRDNGLFHMWLLLSNPGRSVAIGRFPHLQDFAVRIECNIRREPAASPPVPRGSLFRPVIDDAGARVARP